MLAGTFSQVECLASILFPIYQSCLIQDLTVRGGESDKKREIGVYMALSSFLRSSIQVFTTLAPQRVQGASGTKDAYPDAGHRPHLHMP